MLFALLFSGVPRTRKEARLLTLTTNSTPGWTEAIHHLVDNVGLADGSVQTFTIWQLRNATTNMSFCGNG